MTCATYLVPPVRFQEAQLQTSTASNTQPYWEPGSIHGLGAEVLRAAAPARGWMKGIPMLRVFRSTVADNTSDPAADPEKWTNIGPANTVAMFSSKLAEVTTVPELLAVKVAPFATVSAVAFFGLVGKRITLTVRAAAGGVRSTETKELISRPGAVDWLTWFLAPYEQITQAIFLPITCLDGDTLEVEIESDDVAACARMVYGQLTELGEAPSYGASWSMDNYTSADEDEFGFIDPDEGDYAPRQQIALHVAKGRVNPTLTTLINQRGTPCLLIASRDPDYLTALVNFGLVRDPTAAIAYPTHSVLSLEFKGFV